MSKINSLKGYLTLAIGPDFAEMAVDMALSLRVYHKEPISCVVDLPTKIYIDSNYSGVFENLLLLENSSKLGRTRKFLAAKLSPYEETIFLDADIIILNHINQLWESKRGNITMIGEYVDEKKNRIHHGFSSSFLMEKFNTTKYLKSNSGCFYFNKKSADFFNACIKNYKILNQEEFKNHGKIGDELAFGVTAHDYDVKIFNIYPSLMMWDDKLIKLQPKLANYLTPICHFIAPIPKKTLKWIVGECKKRRLKANIKKDGTNVWFKLNNRRIRAIKPSIFKKIIFKLNTIFKT